MLAKLPSGPYQILLDSLRQAVESVHPSRLVQQALKVRETKLEVGAEVYQLDKGKVYVAAFGKAAVGMCYGAYKSLNSSIYRGVASVPVGTFASPHLRSMCEVLGQSPIRLYEGAKDNLPDEAAMETAQKILSMAKELEENDILLTLVSGGGSALLPLPAEGISLDEKRFIIQRLSRRGASIQQLNAVRQNLSKVKNGRLAQMAKPGRVVALILSDIVGNPLDLIGSGPTVSTPRDNDALKIILDFGLEDELSIHALERLNSAYKDFGESPAFSSNVQNVLIGSNDTALEIAKRHFGNNAVIVSRGIEGDADVFAKKLAEIIENFGKSGELHSDWMTFNGKAPPPKLGVNFEKDFTLFFGGEPTVNVVKGGGKGGRCQHIALRVLVELCENLPPKSECHFEDFAFLASGTDGQDGPTDAAGAGLDFGAVQYLRENVDELEFAKSCLRNFDSNSFFSKFDSGRFLLETGPTGTNVMDLYMLFFRK